MAASSGTAGSVVLSGTAVAEIGEWSLNLAHSPVDVTAFGDTWEQYVASIRSATGEFTGNHDDSSTQQTNLRNALLNGTSVALSLYVDGSNYYTIGTAFITGMGPSVSVRGNAANSFTFQVSGPVTYT